MRGESNQNGPWSKGRRPLGRKCLFDQLAVIFAMDMYTFLESARQGGANEPIKTPKS